MDPLAAAHLALAIIRDEATRRGALWVQGVWRGEIDDDYRATEDFKVAEQYYRDFTPKEGAEYKPVIDYIKRNLERYEANDKILDDKADAVIKYLGGGTAVVTAGALLSLRLDNPAAMLVIGVVLALLTPSLGIAFCAISAAINARKPRKAPVTPYGDYAIQVAESYKDEKKTEADLWVMLYPVTVAAAFRVERKAKWVNDAHWYYVRALWFLFLPVIGIVVATIISAAITLTTRT